MQQRSPEWYGVRVGKITASRIADLMAKTKTGYGASRDNYIAQLICERLTGKPQESYTNAAMQWGTDTEPLARSAYEADTGELVEEVGFVLHPTIKDAGASPDGRVGDKGLLEIKCPNTATHIDTILLEKVPGKYNLQMQFQMDCDQRDWCDYVSFDPRVPENIQLFVKRVHRNEAQIKEIREEVVKALAEVEEAVAKLSAK